MKLDSAKEIFGKKVFNLYETIPYLTWRTLFTRFIRPLKDSYLTFDTIFQREIDYAKLVNISYLLGLDIDLVAIKKDLKTQLDRMDSLRKNIEKDEIFKKYFTQGEDIAIETIELEEKIEELENVLKNFEVAENYYEIQKKANDLQYKSQEIKNKLILLENAIKNIDRTLSLKSDITKDSIVSLYEEAKTSIPKMLIRRLEEVENFHSRLMSNRIKRLNAEKAELKKEMDYEEKNRKNLAKQLDEHLKYLGAHKALDEFVAINRKLTDYVSKLEKLNSYKEIIEEYKNETARLKSKFGEENINTNKYLVEAKNLIDTNIKTFRSLSKEFYDDKPGGIEIKNNENINQVRFNIDAKIEDDTSDGINEVKIFCFDMTLLLTHHNHKMNFIFHDSRLYGNMDPRQIATLFRLADVHTRNHENQYIATVNQDIIDSIREHYTNDEYENIIQKNTILTLTDESEKAKLLGVQIDVNYQSS